jgi:SHS2 domain-containing protein
MTILKEFEYEDHTADIKIIGHGNTPKRAIEAAVLGVANLMYDLEKVEKKQTIEVKFNVNDILDVLYYSVKKFLDIFYIDKIAIRDLRVKHLRKIKVKENKSFYWSVDISFFGEKYNKEKHGFKKEVKAVTYHEIDLKRITKAHWIAEIIVDV